MVTSTAPLPTLLEQMALTPLFEGASVETISRLASQGVTRRFRRGTYLFHQGDESPDVYFLISGRVEISSLSSDGHRQLHTTLEIPQFCGELGVLVVQPPTAAALALTAFAYRALLSFRPTGSITVEVEGWFLEPSDTSPTLDD